MKPNTVQNALFPEVPEADAGAAGAREYIKTMASNITSAEATQQKRKDKGKNVSFDPKKAKKLTIFVASSFPAWQEKYVDLVREAFDATHLRVDDKKLNPQVAKMGEMQKAMPFVQGLKRRLMGGENPQAVFDRKLAFDELDILKEAAPALKKTAGCSVLDIVAVDEGGKTGRTLLAEDGSAEGSPVENLPHTADGAVPGSPTFHFQNIEG